MMLLIALLLLSAGMALVVLIPLARRTPGGEADAPLILYRDQLAELDRDYAAGRLTEAGRAAAKLELQRRVLQADKTAARPVSWVPRRALAVPVVALVMAVPLALYLSLGQPGQRDLPISARTAELAPLQAATAAIAEARQQLNTDPDQPMAWLRLAGLLLQRDDTQEAVQLLATARARFPGLAVFPSAQGEALTRAGQGLITGEAEAAFRSALALDPQDPRARYFLALAAEQRGALSEALRDLEVMLAEGPADAPWRATVVAAQTRLRTALGLPPASQAPPAEDPQTQAMIRGMVEGLAARLAQTPDDLAGWQRLARARTVLGETEAAIAAHRQIVRLQPQSVEALLGLARALYPPSADPAGPVPGEFYDLMRRVLSHDPNQPEALWFAGLEAAQQGNKPEALTHLRRLLALLPEDAPPRAHVLSEIERLGP
ncbi:MAG: c-type cytochrome biogenesis protein CcmI [Elstera sp.]